MYFHLFERRNTAGGTEIGFDNIDNFDSANSTNILFQWKLMFKNGKIAVAVFCSLKPLAVVGFDAA